MRMNLFYLLEKYLLVYKSSLVVVVAIGTYVYCNLAVWQYKEQLTE